MFFLYLPHGSDPRPLPATHVRLTSQAFFSFARTATTGLELELTLCQLINLGSGPGTKIKSLLSSEMEHF